MADKTDICNYALSLIGEQVVTNVENADEGPHAVWANRLYQQAKEEVLRMHTWGCARKRVELSENATAPAFGYDNSFALPDKCIRIVSVNDTNPDDVDRPIYERVGDSIFTDETSVYLDYIDDVNEESMDALLIQCVYTLLASKLAWAIQQNRTLREELTQAFERAIKEAKYNDSQERRKPRPNRRRESDWISARYVSTQG